MIPIIWFKLQLLLEKELTVLFDLGLWHFNLIIILHSWLTSCNANVFEII